MALRTRTFTLASYALAAGFYLTLWGAVLGLFVVAAWSWGSAGVWGVPGWALSGWAAFTGVFLVLAQFMGSRRRSAGRALSREDAPALFELIEQVRQELDVAPVREIRLKPAPLLGVTRLWRRHRLFVREQKALVVGLPLLRALTVAELRASVAHELAHFKGGDVRRRRVLNGAWQRITLMRTVLERGGALLTWLNPVYWYLRGYGAVLSRASAAIRRAQECRADSLAAEVAGAPTYARALVASSALSLTFKRLAPSIALGAASGSHPVDNFFERLAQTMEALDPRARVRIVREVLRDPGDPRSEHPPLKERLAFLGVTRVPHAADTSPPASSLVPTLDAIERELTPLAVRGLVLGFRDRLRKRVQRRGKAPERDDGDGSSG